MFKKKYKKLYKYYKFLLRESNKVCFNSLENCMVYFINYLRFMRDYYILTIPISEQKSNTKLTALCYAVYEYESYVSCISNYYTLNSNNILVLKNSNLTHNQTQVLYQTERSLHWKNFWNTVNLNMEDWFNKDEIAF